jgi:hypothetical protein
VRVAEEPAQITLSQVGIDKNLADRARKTAATLRRLCVPVTDKLRHTTRPAPRSAANLVASSPAK